MASTMLDTPRGRFALRQRFHGPTVAPQYFLKGWFRVAMGLRPRPYLLIAIGLHAPAVGWWADG